jgi:hypothetical protein
MKKRILLSETGGTLTRNVIASLRKSKDIYYIIGITSNPYEMALSNADESYLVPEARDPAFIPVINLIAQKTKAQFLHSQHDVVIKVLADHRDEVSVPMFLPATETVRSCVDKFRSYELWQTSGVSVAKSIEIKTVKDVHRAFTMFGSPIWLRLKEGGGGAGSAPVSDVNFARLWIDHFGGWGTFIASEMMSPDSVTWSSIWQNGKLIVAQGRKRLYWLFANRTLSGVTGVTGAAVTVRDRVVDVLAERAILAIDKKPHGIFSVDMTYDLTGHLRVTEINIGRFFTTIHFFTEAGLNMPDIFVRLAFGEKPPNITRRINPLAPGLLWIRGMDTTPVLTRTSVIEGNKKMLSRFKQEV